MDLAHFIESNAYIQKQLHNYMCGVLRDESTKILKKYSPFMAEVVLNGRRPSYIIRDILNLHNFHTSST
jgi:tRNA(adenine34) deaminase